LARALALGATSERPTEPAVDDLRQLAAGDREALARALGRIGHPSGQVGHPGVIASALLRSALDQQEALADELEESAGLGQGGR
jgi:hypothetical protein